MNLKDLQATLRHFAAERDWQPFHNPKNLATALMVEAAELAAIFQWMSPADSRVAHETPDLKVRIGEEIADVLLYLLQVADHSQIEVPQAVRDKLTRNAIKYPAKRHVALSPAPTDQRIGTHVLLDYENVQPSDEALRTLVPSVSDVWVFHGPHQKGVNAKFASFGKQLALVPISRTGNNALDFHLSYYTGYITSRNPGARFVVVANDKGYDPMVEHARTLGFDVERISYVRTSAPAPIETVSSAPENSIAPAKKVATKASVPAKSTAKTAVVAKNPATKKAAAKKTTPKAKVATATTPAKKLPKAPASLKATKTASTVPLSQAKIVESLRKMGNKRPAKMASLQRTVQMLLGPLAAKSEVTTSINDLIAKGTILVGEKGDLSYQL